MLTSIFMMLLGAAMVYGALLLETNPRVRKASWGNRLIDWVAFPGSLLFASGAVIFCAWCIFLILEQV